MKPAPVQVGDIVRLTQPCAPSLIGCLAEVTSVERDKFSAVVTVPGWRHEEPTRTSFLMRFDEAAWEVAARTAVSREPLAVSRGAACRACGGTGDVRIGKGSRGCAVCRGTGQRRASQ